MIMSTNIFRDHAPHYFAKGMSVIPLKENSKIPLINDSNGFFMNSLDLKDNTQNKYFIYKLNSDGTIVKKDEGLVELNSLEKGISEENSKISLEQIAKSL